MAGYEEGAWGHATTRADPGAAGSVAPPGIAGAPEPRMPSEGPTFAGPARRPRRSWLVAATGIAPVAIVLLAVVLSSGGTGNSAAQAIAQAINLEASDLPGFAVSAPGHSSANRPFSARLKGCVGASLAADVSSGQLADISSPNFTNGSGLQAEQVSSDVTIVRSSAVVTRNFVALGSARFRGCVASTLAGMTVPTRSGITLTVSNVRVASLPTAPGANRSLGLRTTLDLGAMGRSVPMVLDILGYGVGKDELTLTAFALDRPFPRQTERQLSSLLISRALSRPH